MFDTQEACSRAKQIDTPVSLNDFLQEYAGVYNTLRKEKGDLFEDGEYWDERPLSKEALACCVQDVTYLHEALRFLPPEVVENQKIKRIFVDAKGPDPEPEPKKKEFDDFGQKIEKKGPRVTDRLKMDTWN